MCLNVYRVFHVNCLASLIAVLRGQQFINVTISQFIEDQSEVLHRLRHVLSARNPAGTVLITTVPIGMQLLSKPRKQLLIKDSLFMSPSPLNPTSVSALWHQVSKSFTSFCEHLKITCQGNAKMHRNFGHFAKYAWDFIKSVKVAQQYLS